MAETYCGKTCAECEKKEQLSCPGCKLGPGKQYGGFCDLARCARDKGHETCDSCIFRGNCGTLRGRDQMADYWNRKTEAQQQLEAEMAEMAPILGKWLWILFWLIIPNAIAAFMTEGIFPVGSGMNLAGTILSGGCMVTYGLIILKLGSLNDRYRKAGILALIASVLNFAVTLVFRSSDTQALELLLLIPAAILSLVGQYHEFMGHSAVLIHMDREFSEKWEILWKWNIGLYLGLIGSLLLVVIIPLLGLLVVLGALIGIIVVSITKLVYVYRMAKFFRNHPQIVQ